MIKIPAKAISYSAKKRSKKDVKFIVIHYTGNKLDTAEANGNFFKNGNTREAGAHFFVDQYGTIVKSINLDRTAWAVGGSKYANCSETGGGKLYSVATNQNSVSIELCDIVDKEPSDDQVKAVAETIKYIRKYCPNATNVIRHFDVTGKPCPKSMMTEEAWNKFQLRLLYAILS